MKFKMGEMVRDVDYGYTGKINNIDDGKQNPYQVEIIESDWIFTFWFSEDELELVQTKLKPDSKVRVKPNKKFDHFKRKIYTVAEIDDKNEYPVLITRNGEYFYFKYDELRLVE